MKLVAGALGDGTPAGAAAVGKVANTLVDEVVGGTARAHDGGTSVAVAAAVAAAVDTRAGVVVAAVAGFVAASDGLAGVAPVFVTCRYCCCLCCCSRHCYSDWRYCYYGCCCRRCFWDPPCDQQSLLGRHQDRVRA